MNDEKTGISRIILHGVVGWIRDRSKTQRSIAMISLANLSGAVVGVAGSLVQANFITPDILGFIRKYSVVSRYAIFFSLGLFIILQREYAVLHGRGDREQANQTVAVVQSWCILVTTVACGSILIMTVIQLFRQNWYGAAAWFIQIVAVWSTLYVGFLDCTFRSGQEFERRAKGHFLGTIGTAVIIPLFWLWPFPTFTLRSVIEHIISGIYLHFYRPVKTGWYFHWGKFRELVKRGMRLFVSEYLRYNFWLTIEIWLMLFISGDKGVGLFVFASTLVDMSAQVITAVNMVYIPQIATLYGQTERIKSCLRFVIKPTLLNFGISTVIISSFWFLLPPVISYAFPKYLGAIPILNILVLRILLISITLPMYMLTILESYLIKLIAAIVGILAFIGTALSLKSMGLTETATPWGTLAGQMTYYAICLLWLGSKLNSQNAPALSS